VPGQGLQLGVAVGHGLPARAALTMRWVIRSGAVFGAVEWV
jgi:hypothetical protein